MKSIPHIVDTHIPTMTNCQKYFGYTQIQGGNSIPLSTTLTSILAYTSSHVTTTIQLTINVNTSLGISTRNPSSFVNSNFISPQQSPLTNLQFIFPPRTYTTPPCSPPSQNTNNDLTLDTIFQIMFTLQQQKCHPKSKQKLPTFTIHLNQSLIPRDINNTNAKIYRGS